MARRANPLPSSEESEREEHHDDAVESPASQLAHLNAVEGRGRWYYALQFAVFLYLAFVLVCWGFIAFLVDDFWPATLLGYGPRWIVLLPIPLLLPFFPWYSRFSVVAFLAAIVIAAWPAAGRAVRFNSPEIRVEGERVPFRILTCNIQQKTNLNILWTLIRESGTDLVFLQECPSELNVEEELGHRWNVVKEGHFVVATKHLIKEYESPIFPKMEKWQRPVLRVRIATPVGERDFYNVHLATPRPGFQAILNQGFAGIAELDKVNAFREMEAAAVSQWIAKRGFATAIAGDFNTVGESRFFRDNWNPYVDSFDAAGSGTGHTKFTRFFGARIDHVLLEKGLPVVKQQVGLDVGSDHRPLLVDVVFGKKAP